MSDRGRKSSMRVPHPYYMAPPMMAPMNGTQPYYPMHPGPDMYFAPPQQPMFPNSPYQNVPPTPFDTAYGASLLPSHLLMGSPMISTPNLPREADMYENGKYNRGPGINMKYGRNGGAPYLSNVYQSSNLNYNNDDDDSNNNNSNGNNSNKSNNHALNGGNNRSRSSLNNKISHNLKMERSYSSGGPVPGMKPNSADGRRKSSIKKRTPVNITKRLSVPFSIRYKVLPKGDDTYKTRSLLFENISNDPTNLRKLMKLIINYRDVESVYLIASEQDIENGDEKKKADENETKKVTGILLSFLSRQAALDFYNNLLQRLPEFKKVLDSKNLAVEFVAFSYARAGSDEENEIENGDSELYTENLLGEEIYSQDATRSIAVEFYNPVDKKSLFEKLSFLNDKTNSRYILESVDIISADEATTELPNNYVILTFINITMAIETIEYLRANLMNYDVNECFFVSVKDRKEPADPSPKSSSLNVSENSNDSSEISLEIENKNITIDRELEAISEELNALDLSENTLEIKRTHYAEPEINIHDEHLPSVLPSHMYIYNNEGPIGAHTPLYLHKNLTDSNSIIGSPFAGFINPTMSHVMIPANGMMGTYDQHSEYGMDPRMLPRFSNTNNVITQSIEDRMNTSAKIAAAMGGDADNRTVYIGNINPRSRVEDICNVVRGGILQNIKFIEEKRICFVTFIEASAAAQFCANSFIDPIVLHGNTLKVGWGHHSGPLPKSIALTVTIGANRNVYVSLPEYAFKDKFINDPKYKEYHEKYKLPSEEQLRKDFSTYGDIEQINYLKDSHCCWVNFINITSAIKLVEDIKHNDGVEFHKKFDNRYEGLIINYGKDRCGNINKNLIAGKNSKFYKKVRKPSYDIRIRRMEENRRRQEDSLREQKQNSIQLDSLGIHVERRYSAASNNEDFQEDDEQDFNEKDEKIGSPNASEPIGIGITTKKSAFYDEHSGSEESVISDMETGLSKETSSSDRKYSGNKNDSFIPKSNLAHAPPRAPTTLGIQYKKNQPPQLSNKKKNKGRSRSENPKNYQNGFGGRQQPVRPIPGSDVMAQYLAQLQHSTFMYAANILGASVDPNDEPTSP